MFFFGGGGGGGRGGNVRGKFYLRELTFAYRLVNRKNLSPQKFRAIRYSITLFTK